jgi:hypothetical protein
VIPAVDEEGTIISIPKLPEREEMKLRAQIQEHADVGYVLFMIILFMIINIIHSE